MDDIIPQDTPLKQCSKCPNSYPATLEFFRYSARTKSGLRSNCRQCDCESARQYHAEHREENLLRMQEYHIEHKEERHQYNAEHKEEQYQYRRQYDLDHKDERRQYKHEYDLEHREEHRVRLQNYRHAYPEKNRVFLHRRRAHKRGNGGTYTLADIERMLNGQHHSCYYCHKQFKKANGKYIFHVDHIVPLSRGGSNGPDNLVLACPPCNYSKGDKLLHEWARGGRLL